MGTLPTNNDDSDCDSSSSWTELDEEVPEQNIKPLGAEKEGKDILKNSSLEHLRLLSEDSDGNESDIDSLCARSNHSTSEIPEKANLPIYGCPTLEEYLNEQETQDKCEEDDRTTFWEKVCDRKQRKGNKDKNTHKRKGRNLATISVIGAILSLAGVSLLCILTPFGSNQPISKDLKMRLEKDLLHVRTSNNGHKIYLDNSGESLKIVDKKKLLDTILESQLSDGSASKMKGDSKCTHKCDNEKNKFVGQMTQDSSENRIRFEKIKNIGPVKIKEKKKSDAVDENQTSSKRNVEHELQTNSPNAASDKTLKIFTQMENFIKSKGSLTSKNNLHNLGENDKNIGTNKSETTEIAILNQHTKVDQTIKPIRTSQFKKLEQPAKLVNGFDNLQSGGFGEFKKRSQLKKVEFLKADRPANNFNFQNTRNNRISDEKDAHTYLQPKNIEMKRLETALNVQNIQSAKEEVVNKPEKHSDLKSLKLHIVQQPQKLLGDNNELQDTKNDEIELKQFSDRQYKRPFYRNIKNTKSNPMQFNNVLPTVNIEQSNVELSNPLPNNAHDILNVKNDSTIKPKNSFQTKSSEQPKIQQYNKVLSTANVEQSNIELFNQPNNTRDVLNVKNDSIIKPKNSFQTKSNIEQPKIQQCQKFNDSNHDLQIIPMSSNQISDSNSTAAVVQNKHSSEIRADLNKNVSNKLELESVNPSEEQGPEKNGHSHTLQRISLNVVHDLILLKLVSKMLHKENKKMKSLNKLFEELAKVKKKAKKATCKPVSGVKYSGAIENNSDETENRKNMVSNLNLPEGFPTDMNCEKRRNSQEENANLHLGTVPGDENQNVVSNYALDGSSNSKLSRELQLGNIFCDNQFDNQSENVNLQFKKCPSKENIHKTRNFEWNWNAIRAADKFHLEEERELQDILKRQIKIVRKFEPSSEITENAFDKVDYKYIPPTVNMEQNKGNYHNINIKEDDRLCNLCEKHNSISDFDNYHLNYSTSYERIESLEANYEIAKQKIVKMEERMEKYEDLIQKLLVSKDVSQPNTPVPTEALNQNINLLENSNNLPTKPDEIDVMNLGKKLRNMVVDWTLKKASTLTCLQNKPPLLTDDFNCNICEQKPSSSKEDMTKKVTTEDQCCSNQPNLDKCPETMGNKWLDLPLNLSCSNEGKSSVRMSYSIVDTVQHQSGDNEVINEELGEVNNIVGDCPPSENVREILPAEEEVLSINENLMWPTEDMYDNSWYQTIFEKYRSNVMEDEPSFSMDAKKCYLFDQSYVARDTPARDTKKFYKPRKLQKRQ